MAERDNNDRYLVIVAGGAGLRMGSSTPKQFLLLGGRPVIFRSIERFTAVFPNIKIVVVLAPGIAGEWKNLCKKFNFNNDVIVTEGGRERFFSVKNGLDCVKGNPLVAVHDAVRPFVSAETIKRCFDEAEKKGNAVPVIAPSESVREMTGNETSRPADRSVIRLVQTPQVFRYKILKDAYDAEYCDKYTDDATVAEDSGIMINAVEGNRENIKITSPYDLLIGEAILKSMPR